MSIFNTILQKLGLEKPAAPVTPVKPAPAPVAPVKPAPVAPVAPPPAAKAPPAPAATTAAPVKTGMKPAAPPAEAAASVKATMKSAPKADDGDDDEMASRRTMPAAAAPVVVAPVVAPVVPVAPAAISIKDVYAQLETLSHSHPGLNWKGSIADLLQMLGIDHGYAARKELAIELGCPEKLMADSASMNIWLHKTVLQKIAENGGNIPQTLLD